MASRKIHRIKIKATGEVINASRLTSGEWSDYDNMGADQPPQAIKAGKKIFNIKEVEDLGEVKS